MSATGTGAGLLQVVGNASGAAYPAGAAAGLLEIVGDGSAQAYPSAIGAGLLEIVGDGAVSVYPAGVGDGLLQIVGEGIAYTIVTGTGDGLLRIVGAGAGGPLVTGTGAGILEVTGSGGDYPVGAGVGLLEIVGASTGYVGTAANGRWLHLHTTPPAQIYATDALRGRLNPYLPSHRIDWSATDVRAEVGRTNDSWAAELIGANPTLRNRLATQAAYGIRVDLYDGGDIARTGISYGVGYNDRSLILDVQSDVWTRDIPMRTSADLGTFRDVETLPIRYGRNVPGKLISINQARTLWLWADHASLAIRSVTIDGQPYGAWSWRNDIDGSGHPITIVQTSEQIDDGADMVAVGDGAMDADTGALLVNPSDIARDLCRLGGLTVARSDFAGYRAECLDRNLELSGTVDGGSLQAVMTRIADSTHSAFARQLPGYLRLLPLSAPAVATISPDAVLRADQEGDIATRLRVRYGVEEKGPRRSIEVRAPAIEVRYGVKSQDVDLPMIRDDRSAVDVASRMLVDLARPAYRVQCKRQQREWLPGEVASVSVLALGISGNAMVQASQIGERSSAPTLLLHVGDEPAISLVTVAQAYSPETYTGATVTTQGANRIVTITDDNGRPIAGARCTLDRSITRTTDNGGRVAFPIAALGPGSHVIDVVATGYQAFQLPVVI